MNWKKSMESKLTVTVFAITIIGFTNFLVVHADGPSFPPKFEMKISLPPISLFGFDWTKPTTHLRLFSC